MSDPEYDYPKEDIETALRYLRLNISEYATPKNAIRLLSYYHGHIENLEESHPEVIEEMLKDFERH